MYPGTKYRGRKLDRWAEKLFKQHKCCVACGSKENLQPHHIIPCTPFDKLFHDLNNGTVLCQSCHDRYHQKYFKINHDTLMEYCKNYKKQSKKQKKKFKKYNRRKYELSPNYTKIKINDFRKKVKKPKSIRKKKKYKKRRKNKVVKFNPIYLSKNLGCDEWDYFDKINLEREVLGDLCEENYYKNIA